MRKWCILWLIFSMNLLWSQEILKLPQEGRFINSWEFEHVAFDFWPDNSHVRLIDGFHNLSWGAVLPGGGLFQIKAPMAVHKYIIEDWVYPDESSKIYESTIGNPHVSLYLPIIRNGYLMLSVTAPLVSEKRIFTFLFRGISDDHHLEDFTPHMWAFKIGMNKNFPVNDRFAIRNVGSLKLSYLSEDNPYLGYGYDKLEKWLFVQNQLEFRPFENRTTFFMGLRSHFWISENRLNISELSRFLYEGGIVFYFQNIKSQVFYKLPVDEPATNVVKGMIGFAFTATI